MINTKFRLGFILLSISLTYGHIGVQGADLIRILPVTDDILMASFKEGHIAYNGVRPDGTYAPQTENQVFYKTLLNVESASNPAAYRIASADDPRFHSGRHPLHVGYKAKGTEFNAPWKNPPFLREYWVYVQLPEAMQSGRTYTVHVGDLAENRDEYVFTFDAKSLRSPTIHVSQVGFPPDAPKHAYFSQWMGTFNSAPHRDGALSLARYADGVFHICDAESGAIRKTYRGLQLQKEASAADPSHGNWTGADVYSLDFSDFREPGRYVVMAEGMGRSHPFEIAENVYAAAHRVSMRSLFLQRRGIVKDLEEFGMEYPRSHHPEINEFVYGRVHGEGGAIDDPKPVRGIWGWYADAGDWDGYPSHYVVPYTLLFTYDLRPRNFRDGDYGNRWKERPGDSWIDEGANGVPDLLDEARWLIDFYRRARHELMRQNLGTGGVPGYVGRDADSHFQPSWNDRRVLYVSLEDPRTTYSYAGAAAYFAHCLNKHQRLSGRGDTHPDSAAWLDEARSAFRWAEGREPDSEDVQRHRQLAAVALYLATGDDAWQRIFRAEWPRDEQRNHAGWVSPSANMLASGIYLVSCKDLPNLDDAFYADVRANILRRADSVTNHVDQIGFRVGGVEPGQWIRMNLITVPRAIFQAIAYELTGDRKYTDSMHTALAYVFGGNQEGRSRLTGVGQSREQDVFVCDAWYLLDFRHKAYRNPIFPGHSAYGLLCTWDVGGPGSESWARASALPAVEQWPLGEQRMRSRYSIAASEFTVHQNHPWYIFATGYFLSDERDALAPFARPSVRLQLEKNPRISSAVPVTLAATSPTAERVEYYYDWHFIGESTDRKTDFAVSWDIRQTDLHRGDEVLITAIAYDRAGESSIPSPEGERMVTIAE